MNNCFFFVNQGELGFKGVNGGGGPKGNRGRGVCNNKLYFLTHSVNLKQT